MNKSKDQIILDRQLIEAVGFPSTVNGIVPDPDLDKICELLQSGATFDHYVPNDNNASHTWQLTNAFILASKNDLSEFIIPSIIDNCIRWKIAHTIIRHDISSSTCWAAASTCWTVSVNSLQIKSFNRAINATPLGLCFAYPSGEHWRRVIIQRFCVNPILDFLVYSLDLHITDKETKFSQLIEIANNYNFATVLKADLRMLAEFAENQSVFTISNALQQNLKILFEFISNKHFDNGFDKTLISRYLHRMLSASLKSWDQF